jgi:hypothetical protein
MIDPGLSRHQEGAMHKPLVLLACALFGALVGACGDDEAERRDEACTAYCERSVECNPDSFGFDTCHDYCVAVVNECPSGKKDAAIDHYASCGEEICNALYDCSFEAEDECN